MVDGPPRKRSGGFYIAPKRPKMLAYSFPSLCAQGFKEGGQVRKPTKEEVEAVAKALHPSGPKYWKGESQAWKQLYEAEARKSIRALDSHRSKKSVKPKRRGK